MFSSAIGKFSHNININLCISSLTFTNTESLLLLLMIFCKYYTLSFLSTISTKLIVTDFVANKAN